MTNVQADVQTATTTTTTTIFNFEAKWNFISSSLLCKQCVWLTERQEEEEEEEEEHGKVDKWVV